ncbi:DUF445 family protein [Staphylococcus sp. SQ8-PEA]|uniref:DUF445 family protein n=1 Tax=Staphylococcus marylandisciuri TaxID=2981529 RepID=A0ABT2QS70_9STAP|nr:DUF445 family protein [Staphylococcus marylandisciuri]MCU5746799.1 DUF445 family protein [Staphylococcus marylandisciuri]
MHAIVLILFMVVIGAVIGGITNMIAVRMLFHPFKPYYLFGLRLPFTPGLIPKRREEIATKIGQVIEDHLLTETLIKSKLNEPSTRDSINEILFKQVQKLKRDNVSIQYFANKLDINAAEVLSDRATQLAQSKIDAFYNTHQEDKIEDILPDKLITYADDKIANVSDLLFSRARVYLTSDKGVEDINSMLDTFFQEKGKIIGLLQMFMTKEHIAERIRSELIRLTNHPKARQIARQVIDNEYETFKSKTLKELISKEKFDDLGESFIALMIEYIDIDEKTTQPLNQVMPSLIRLVEENITEHLTSIIIDNVSTQISPIMQRINLRGMIEQQINTFDLDYIERLIIEIANKELKLIMLLGFLLGGIIGCLQGVIAIFV